MDKAAAGAGGGGGGNTTEEDEQQFGIGIGMNSSGSSASIARFPKLDECAHFHYEHVELGRLEVSLSEAEQSTAGFAVRVTSGDACWTLQRSYENLVMFDRQLHRCIFDRSYSQLAELTGSATAEPEMATVAEYLRRFSALSHDGLNCGPVLNWLQLDNRGRRILVPEADSCPINTPAVAAAYAVRPHRAQASDEISFQVGDMISVIDMPPAGESSWWRGKRGFDVGFFPAECVALIGDKLPRHLAATAAASPTTSSFNGGQHPHPLHHQQPVKPVLRKHGKLIAFFRSFILNRPSRRRLKQSGILRERVFGCDLGEHLLNTGREVPSVLSCCADFIERHGLVDGIYRLSGVTSNIQRLRHAFDEDRLPVLNADESILQDIHSVASLLKMYFRELPNPLCTYQLYSTFVSAVQSPSDAERLARMRDAVRKLPPPHYRTLEYLMRHLVRVAARGEETGMTPRNVAIVWAPNLLRCKELEVGGVAALQGVGVQAVVTEFLICYAELIFAAGPAGTPLAPAGQRPKSLAIASNSTRLLTLEEARSRSLAPEPELIEVGPGAAGLPARYHTVIELPPGQRKRTGSKRSPSLNWRALFGRATGPARQSTKATVAATTIATGPSTASGSESLRARALGISAPMPIAGTPASISSPVGASSIQTERRGQLRPVKSADSLDGASEDGLGPLLAPAASSRACGHSRSVSHDSYFEQLADAASSAPSAAASALDLSEIQLSFELEEREMRMLSGEESLEASPRRQRPKQETGPEPTSGAGASSSGSDDGTGGTGGSGLLMPVGGSKRKRSRLEERLQCEVELRFIDSQSPDQIMVSADVHETDTPSPLPTPGYLPLLSEASTPLTPNTSPAAVSPRISFKSFSLPLEVDEVSSPRNQNVCARLDLGEHSEINQNNAMEACEDFINGSAVAEAGQQRSSFVSSSADFFDQEMTLCDRLLKPRPNEVVTKRVSLDNSLTFSNAHQAAEQNKNRENTVAVKMNETLSEKSVDQDDKAQNINTSNLPNIIDQDSPMICEQSYEPMLPTTIVSDVINTNNQNCNDQKKQEFSSDFEEAEKWLTTNTPQIGLMSSEETTNKQPQENQCIENSDVLNKVQDRQGTLNCYPPSDRIHLERSSPNNMSNFHLSYGDGNFRCASIIENINEPKLTNVELNANLLLGSNNLEVDQSNSNFGNTRSDYEVNEHVVKNVSFETDNIESQVLCWKSMRTDNSQCEISKNEKSVSKNSNDQISDCFNEKISEIGVNNEQSESVVEAHAYVDSKESESVSGNQSVEQGTNSCDNEASTFNKKYSSKHMGQECSSSIADPCAQDDLGVVVPLESAAVEPQEMAHIPDELSNASTLCASASPSNDKRVERNSVMQKDTAAILQELALQRLSGSDRLDSTLPRRRLDSEYLRDRRSFDSEIGREIVREHKMKQELENARGKVDESLKNSHNQTAQTPHLPPCLRARHARATRAALSRSLDEAKFNKMTGGSEPGSAGRLGQSEAGADEPRRMQQQQQQPRLGSTPDFGSSSNSSSGSSRSSLGGTRSGVERSTQSLNKNFGIDLDDPRCRERIEKYKEERRTFLRDKYRSESFRAAASSAAASDKQQPLAVANKEDEALLARLKQRASNAPL